MNMPRDFSIMLFLLDCEQIDLLFLFDTSESLQNNVVGQNWERLKRVFDSVLRQLNIDDVEQVSIAKAFLKT